MCRSQQFALVCTLIALFPVAGRAHAEDHAEDEARLAARLDVALRAACYGLEVEGVDVHGHVFDVASARFVRAGSLTVIEGELRYRSPSQSNHRVNYTIRKRGAALLSAELYVAKSPSAKSVSLARHLVGVVVPDDRLESVARRIARLADGGWQSAAELIVTSIALRADAFGRDRLAMYRARLSHAVHAPSRTFSRSAQTVIIPRSDREPRDRS